MKFEKFLKSCGTHGQIVKRENGDKWLVCGGVGMKVPTGVVNLLGAGEVSEKTREIVEAIVTADTDEKIQLTEATLPADGKASDIIRVFSDGYNRVRIHNADFGLLERADVILAYLEIIREDDDLNELIDRFLLVLDPAEEVIGFITGVPEN
jgi:hypothetical protein